MKSNRALYLGLILLLLAVDRTVFNFKVNVIAKAGLQDSQSGNEKDSNKGGELSSVSDSNGVDKEKNRNKNQGDGLKENGGGNTLNNDNSLGSRSKPKKDDAVNAKSKDLSGRSESKKTDDPKKGKNDSIEKGKGKAKNDSIEKGKGKVDDSKEKTTPKEENVSAKGDSGLSSKDAHVEECDPSNMCTDKENQLVACVRAQGNDKQYSLLVQNKGKVPLAVTISAPDYVQLEKEIKLQSKEDKKIQVSITHGGSDSMIVLRAGRGHCDLDIKHLVNENFGQDFDSSRNTGYINFLTRTPMVVLAFAALLMLAASWTCISFRRKQLVGGGSKYQRLDVELPVSAERRAESEQNDGWDDKWGDDWDDEEAPNTPSLPVTPSFSSKGLASRRSSKEGWKD